MTVLNSLTGARSAIITGCAVAALCLPTAYCTGFKAGKARIEAAQAAATVQITQEARGADAKAAVERVADATRNLQTEGALIDAIQSVTDSTPDAASVALGCQRVRASGTPYADLPAVCRPSGGDGTQATTRP